MSENPKITEIRQSVKNSYQELIQMMDNELIELPTENLYQAPDAAGQEWSVMQCFAHILEIMPYWGNQIARLVALPGQAFGRVMTDEARNLAIKQYGNDRLEQARAVLPYCYLHLDAILSSLKDSDLELTGVHSRFGEKPLAWFMHEFVTNHLVNHIKQLRECLTAIA